MNAQWSSKNGLANKWIQCFTKNTKPSPSIALCVGVLFVVVVKCPNEYKCISHLFYTNKLHRKIAENPSFETFLN